MPVLSRLQRNQIHTILSKHGLDAADFAWEAKTEERRLVEGLHHRPTEARIAFSESGETFWVTWWPNFQDGHRPHGLLTWAESAQMVELWAALVRKNHQAPDLWGEVAKAKGIPSAAGDFGAENSRFNPTEIALLKPRLDEIEEYVAAQQPLTEQQRRALRQRFDYLLGAAKRGVGRIDWLNIFVSQVLQLITDQLLDASLYSGLMQHASQLFRSAIDFGAKLLESGTN